MNRNTILYILVALLVVGGITWLIVSRSTDDVTDGDTPTEVDSEEMTDDAEEEERPGAEQTGENGQINGNTPDNSNETDTDTTTITANDSDSTPVGGAGEAAVAQSSGNGSTVEVTVREVSVSTQELRGQLSVQTELLEALVSVVALELEAGNLTPEEAASMLEDLTTATEGLGELVEELNQRS